MKISFKELPKNTRFIDVPFNCKEASAKLLFLSDANIKALFSCGAALAVEILAKHALSALFLLFSQEMCFYRYRAPY